MINNPPLPLKEANLLHQLVTDYERYKMQGFPTAAEGVLQLIKQTVDLVLTKPELFQHKEELVIATKSGEQTITQPDRLGLKQAMNVVSAVASKQLDKLAQDIVEEAKQRPVKSSEEAQPDRADPEKEDSKTWDIRKKARIS